MSHSLTIRVFGTDCPYTTPETLIDQGGCTVAEADNTVMAISMVIIIPRMCIDIKKVHEYDCMFLLWYS